MVKNSICLQIITSIFKHSANYVNNLEKNPLLNFNPNIHSNAANPIKMKTKQSCSNGYDKPKVGAAISTPIKLYLVIYIKK